MDDTMTAEHQQLEAREGMELTLSQDPRGIVARTTKYKQMNTKTIINKIS